MILRIPMRIRFFFHEKSPCQMQERKSEYYADFKCTHSRNLGALYQFVVRKPDGVTNDNCLVL